MTLGYTLFETALGACGLAWSERGIARLELPGQPGTEIERRLLAKAGEARKVDPPDWVAEATRRIRLHLAGQPQDFNDLRLDLREIAPFHLRVYQAVRCVRAGATVTYGELATLADSPGAARAVGQAMAKNPIPLIVPCHRVLSAGGLGGFQGTRGLRLKRQLLALEGVRPKGSLFQGNGRLPYDPKPALQALRKADSKLAEVMDEIGPFRLKLESIQSPFEALAEAIVYQQLSGKAAATILGRFRALFDPSRFPGPEEVQGASDARLRSAGLSGGKAASLRDLAAKTLAGVIPPLAELEALGDEQIIERLTEVRGVGRWTVQMLLIFRLGRPDVLPATDFGIRKALAKMLRSRGLPSPEQVERRGRRWQPFRSVASWYLWRALEIE